MFASFADSISAVHAGANCSTAAHPLKPTAPAAAKSKTLSGDSNGLSPRPGAKTAEVSKCGRPASRIYQFPSATGGSFSITQPHQVCLYGPLQFRGLSELGVQFRDETRHLLLEWVAVVFHFRCTYVSARRK